MPDFLGLGKLRSNNDTKTSTAGSSPAKKDPNAPQPTPLERMLENAGPIRNDGSDKFFGMENFGNTCYCNSILQCLYNTPRFRENILAYPHHSTFESIAKAVASVPPRPPYKLQNGVLIKPGQPVVQSKVLTPTTQPGQKPEDKDSPEYKKKLALVAGPIVNMSYQNNASYDMPESMFTSLKDVFEALVAEQNRSGIVSPTRFLEVLRRDNEMFRSAMHQDAHEFLNLVLNSVMESIEEHEKKVEDNKQSQPSEGETDATANQSENAVVSWPPILPVPTNQSHTKWLRDMFEGTLTSETRCLTCETTSHRDEPFLDLSVDLEQHSSVTSCLNRFSREEMLCERDKFHCDNCGGLQEAEKRMKIKRLPQILALHLKRFKYTEDLARLQKLFHKVVYPYHLRLFNTSDETDDPDRLYELYAVVVHIGGGPYHGHYVAIIKTQDRGWLLFDDEMVEPVDRSYIQNFFGSPTGLACAYVLFYRQTTEEEVLREQYMDGKRRASQDLPQDQVRKSAEQPAEVHRAITADTSLSPLDTSQLSNLDHATTAPVLSPNGTVEPQKSPYSILSPIGLGNHSRKEKAKEEKERKAAEKAAEKERDKVEKQRKKEAEQQQKDAQKRQNEEQNKLEEERKNGATELGEANGSTSRDLFRRSKSFKFGSLGRRDRSALTAPSTTTTTTTTEETSTQNPHLLSSPTNGGVNGSAIDEVTDTTSADKEKEKKNRFSLRKKSFGLLP